MLQALAAALALGLVMTAGDFVWAALHIRHRVAYGLIHGAVVCLCIAIAIGIRAKQPTRAAMAGPIIGVVAAAAFYALVPGLGWGALFPAWMLFWILFAMLQRQLRRAEGIRAAAVRGALAALLSGIAFYLIAFLPGFVVLFRA